MLRPFCLFVQHSAGLTRVNFGWRRIQVFVRLTFGGSQTFGSCLALTLGLVGKWPQLGRWSSLAGLWTGHWTGQQHEQDALWCFLLCFLCLLSLGEHARFRQRLLLWFLSVLLSVYRCILRCMTRCTNWCTILCMMSPSSTKVFAAHCDLIVVVD